MAASMRYGFTVYANSYHEAEQLRDAVAGELTEKSRVNSLPEWDIDADVIDYGEQEDEDEDTPQA